jgi:hypothetical protein
MLTRRLRNSDARAGNGVGHHRFCVIAEAALAAMLLLSAHDPAATTGPNHACAVGKEGLRNRAVGRPARRHEQAAKNPADCSQDVRY